MANFTAEDLRELTVYDGGYYVIDEVKQKLNITDEDFARVFRGCTLCFKKIQGVEKEMIPTMDVMDVAVQGIPRD